MLFDFLRSGNNSIQREINERERMKENIRMNKKRLVVIIVTVIIIIIIMNRMRYIIVMITRERIWK